MYRLWLRVPAISHALLAMKSLSRRRAPALVPAVLALVLGACAEVRLAAYTAKEIQARVEKPQPTGTYKVGEPYRVRGAWYYPTEDPDYDEVGIASWYGEQFHGRRTANGSLYDMSALTAAHKTLPMPSLVKVTNLENGRSLTLTINDRGPFASGRIIDVSRRAAQLLGFHGKGTTKVRVRAVRDGLPATLIASQPPPAAPAPPEAVTRELPPEFMLIAAPPERAAMVAPEDFTRAPPPAITLADATHQAITQEPLAAVTFPVAATRAIVAEDFTQHPPAITLAAASPPEAAIQEPPPPIALAAAPPAAPPATMIRKPPPPKAVGREPPPWVMLAAATPAPPPAFQAVATYIQAGAFTKLDNARRLTAKLSRFGPTRTTRAWVGGREFYRVRIGPIGNRAEADAVLIRVIAAGHRDALSVVD